MSARRSVFRGFVRVVPLMLALQACGGAGDPAKPEGGSEEDAQAGAADKPRPDAAKDSGVKPASDGSVPDAPAGGDGPATGTDGGPPADAKRDAPPVTCSPPCATGEVCVGGQCQ